MSCEQGNLCQKESKLFISFIVVVLKIQEQEFQKPFISILFFIRNPMLEININLMNDLKLEDNVNKQLTP